MPPVAEGVGLPWDVVVEDAWPRSPGPGEAYGDTFMVRTGRDQYLFTFSPTGVESFYALPEEVASKGLADYLMLRRKLPDEVFDGRRTLPHLLFRKGDVVHYLANLDHALEATVAELGDARHRGRLRPHPSAGAPDGARLVGRARLHRGRGVRAAGRRVRRSSTAPTRSCTRTRWPPWPPPARPRSGPRSPR